MVRQITRLAVVLIATVSLCGPAFAHEHEDRGMQGPLQYGYQNGYLDGFQHGVEDLRAGVGYSYESRDYDSAMRGYESYMGSDRQYRDGYREGYRAGYNDGYHGRSARFIDPSDQAYYSGDRRDYERGDAYDHQSVAFRIGYEDGLIDGGKDRRKHKDFQPSKHDRYEDADHGYSHDYGNKKEYKREYREGYVAGYQRGYRDVEGALYR